ncbi:methyltransferase [Azospirillum sp. TSO22-1]|uniref:methyltransferase family protein n=1 Tax=Azospirillum sp. TSO22-1 TaxID=716789 RepID=UPI000D64C6C4|nr:methyltransferase [Azospirillum sp. TSO22-1]
MPHTLYALAWASFGLGHSLLAIPRVAARLRLGAYTRLAYNGFAALHLLAVLAAGRWLLPDPLAFARPPELAAVQAVAALAGLGVFLWGVSGYDLGRFAGVTQIRAHRTGAALPADEPLRVRGANRWVRHPLYTGALLMLWGVVADERALATALWASLYLLAGMRHEERALEALYGDAYRDYKTKVPALLPWRGRAPR